MVKKNKRQVKPFAALNDHMLDCGLESNHVYRLVKEVAWCFLTIRLHHMARKATSKCSGARLRKS